MASTTVPVSHELFDHIGDLRSAIKALREEQKAAAVENRELMQGMAPGDMRDQQRAKGQVDAEQYREEIRSRQEGMKRQQDAGASERAMLEQIRTLRSTVSSIKGMTSGIPGAAEFTALGSSMSNLGQSFLGGSVSDIVTGSIAPGLMSKRIMSGIKRTGKEFEEGMQRAHDVAWMERLLSKMGTGRAGRGRDVALARLLSMRWIGRQPAWSFQGNPRNYEDKEESLLEVMGRKAPSNLGLNGYLGLNAALLSKGVGNWALRKSGLMGVTYGTAIANAAKFAGGPAAVATFMFDRYEGQASAWQQAYETAASGSSQASDFMRSNRYVGTGRFLSDMGSLGIYSQAQGRQNYATTNPYASSLPDRLLFGDSGALQAGREWSKRIQNQAFQRARMNGVQDITWESSMSLPAVTGEGRGWDIYGGVSTDLMKAKGFGAWTGYFGKWTNDIIGWVGNGLDYGAYENGLKSELANKITDRRLNTEAKRRADNLAVLEADPQYKANTLILHDHLRVVEEDRIGRIGQWNSY